MRTIFFRSCCVCSSAARLSTCFSWCTLMAEISVSVLSRRAFNAARLASIAERRELVSTTGGAALEPLAPLRPAPAATVPASTLCGTSSTWIAGAPPAGRAGTSASVTSAWSRRGPWGLHWNRLASSFRHTLVERQVCFFLAQVLQAEDLGAPHCGSQTRMFLCLHASQRSSPLATHSSTGSSSLSSTSGSSSRRRRCLGGASGD
ncbi:hypothetical protein EDB85DRAFT_1979970 [Lactarius pseudohatsudake]|nr:hypothetical protein EDB85DRAFT_1979970 [Lactarius pseudohatsudake]